MAVAACRCLALMQVPACVQMWVAGRTVVYEITGLTGTPSSSIGTLDAVAMLCLAVLSLSRWLTCGSFLYPALQLQAQVFLVWQVRRARKSSRVFCSHTLAPLSRR